MTRFTEFPIGRGYRVFVIAEAGVNHNGSLENAFALVDVAIEAGADAIKFQTFKAEQVASPYAPKATYQKNSGDCSERQLDMIRKLELSYDNFARIYNYCEKKKIKFLSTPFDYQSVHFLSKLGMKLFKIPSGEINHHAFLEEIAKYADAVILSTGMSMLGEVESAISVFEKAGVSELALLHCVSNYPASPQDANLKAMSTMAQAFLVPVGFSDHTLGIEVSLAAVALGACVIEKHFTLDKNLPGPDHKASLDPAELRNLVKGIRTVEGSLGSGIKKPVESELKIAEAARRSLVAATAIPAGTRITEELIAIKRPGTGIQPNLAELIIGRTAKNSLDEGALFKLEDLN